MDKCLKASSEILPELYCETCHNVDGNFYQATGYCHYCAEYLCIDCVAEHKRAKLSRNHELDDEYTMQKKKPQIKQQDSAPAMLKDLKVLGQLTINNATSSVQMLKSPTHLKDIDIETTDNRGYVMLTNQQLLITDYYGKVTLIDTKTSTIVSELHLPETLWDMTKVKSTEVAITCPCANKILFVSVSSNTLSKVQEMSLNDDCHAIVYNDHDQTLVVTFDNPPKVEILNMAGSVLRSFDKFANGGQLFTLPRYIALSPDQTLMYISDQAQNSVTAMTMQGEVKTVYKDDELNCPCGICVNKSGIVYVVCYNSYTLHQILPGSDKLELLFDQEEGLTRPWTITYCDKEDKLYVGQNDSNMLKVFQMK